MIGCDTLEQDAVNEIERLADMGDADAALLRVSSTLKNDPRDYDAWTLKGDLLARSGDHKEAMRCYDRVLVKRLNDDSLWRKKARLLLDMGRLDEASRSVRRALDVREEAATLVVQGRIALKKKDFDAARSAFERAVSQDPEDPEAWVNLGETMSMGFAEFSEALKCFDQTLVRDPFDVRAWINKGVAQRSMKDFKGAIKCFNRVLSIGGSDREAERYKRSCIKALGEDWDPERDDNDDVELDLGALQNGGVGVMPDEIEDWDDATVGKRKAVVKDRADVVEDWDSGADVVEDWDTAVEGNGEKGSGTTEGSIDVTCPKCGEHFDVHPEGDVVLLECPKCGSRGKMRIE